MLTACGVVGMARTCCSLHAYSEAEDYYGRAYSILSDSLGAEHSLVLDTMTDHAGVLIALSRFTHAEQVYRTVLDMRWEYVHMPPCVRAGCQLMADCTIVSAAIREKQSGPDDPGVATALTNMGQLLQRQGRFAQAEPLLRRAVKIQEHHHGDTHLQA